MSSVTATDSEASEFLQLLERICEQQKTISAQLDEMVLLLQMPSEDVLRVLQQLLIPLGQDLSNCNLKLLRAFLPNSQQQEA